MTWKTIEKPRQDWAVVPNLLDYERSAGGILLGRRPGAHSTVFPAAADSTSLTKRLIATRAGPHRDHLALRWLGKRGEVRDFTYVDLYSLTNRFANVLKRLGVGKGERVFLLGRAHSRTLHQRAWHA